LKREIEFTGVDRERVDDKAAKVSRGRDFAGPGWIRVAALAIESD
jgi:hypothetical protein